VTPMRGKNLNVRAVAMCLGMRMAEGVCVCQCAGRGKRTRDRLSAENGKKNMRYGSSCRGGDGK
jgi:hypothetical protein